MKRMIAVIMLAYQGFCQAGIVYLETPQELMNWTMQMQDNIEEKKIQALEEFQKGFSLLLQQETATFSNTIEAFDRLAGNLMMFASFCEAIGLVHPNSQVQQQCDEAQSQIRSVLLSSVLEHPKLYQEVCHLLKEKDSLNAEDRYYLEQMNLDLERLGCHLSEDKKKALFCVQNDLTQLSLLFQKNIREDNRCLWVEEKELEGVAQNVLQAMAKEEGRFKLTCDYPIYLPVMNSCSIGETRKKLQALFSNRAYPANKAVLESLIEKRNTLASLLGFASFAEYELSSQMVNKVESVHSFLTELMQNFKQQIEKEFVEMTKDLPQGLTLTKEDKMYSYDVPFIVNHYKKQKFCVDERKISEYFPVEETLLRMISLYEDFFSLEMKEISSASFWHPDVRLFQVVAKNTKKLQGYLLFDLYPRQGKYSHACCASMVPAYTENDKQYPAVSLIVTNFPKKTEQNPAFLTHDQARVLFHEFGHSLHNILGRSNRMMTCGTQVKTDFVELPSQLLEEWLWDAKILKRMSCHYETKKPLSDELIRQMLQAKNCDAGFWLQRQCFLSTLSLEYFAGGVGKDTDQVLSSLRSTMMPQYIYDAQDHFSCSFSHLDGYGSKYYGYLWARMLAADVFAKIRSMGLVNPKAGALYLEKILGKGGRQDPNLMLLDFLGREPDSKFFIQNLMNVTQ